MATTTATKNERGLMTHLKDEIVGAKDRVVGVFVTAKDGAGEKIVGAKDGVVDGAVEAKDWTGDKMVKAKDGTGEKIEAVDKKITNVIGNGAQNIADSARSHTEK